MQANNGDGVQSPSLGSSGSQDILHGNSINISQTIERALRFRAELGTAERPIPMFVLHPTLAGEDQPLAVRADSWAVFPCGCVDDWSEIFWLRPDSVLVVADKQVGVSKTRLTTKTTDQ